MEEVSYGGCCLGLYCIGYIYSAAASSWCFMQRWWKSQPIPLDPNQSRVHDWPLYLQLPLELSMHVLLLYVRSSSLLIPTLPSIWWYVAAWIPSLPWSVASERSKNCAHFDAAEERIIRSSPVFSTLSSFFHMIAWKEALIKRGKGEEREA